MVVFTTVEKSAPAAPRTAAGVCGRQSGRGGCRGGLGAWLGGLGQAGVFQAASPPAQARGAVRAGPANPGRLGGGAGAAPPPAVGEDAGALAGVDAAHVDR